MDTAVQQVASKQVAYLAILFINAGIAQLAALAGMTETTFDPASDGPAQVFAGDICTRIIP
jgi:hypothetical protein